MEMKEWCAVKRKERCAELIAFFGGPAQLAAFLGVAYTTVAAWRDRNGLSLAGARKVDKLTGGRFRTGYLYPTAADWFNATQKAGRNGKD